MIALRLSLVGSDGTPAAVPYLLPTTLVFDCFVPLVGICKADVNVSAEDIDVEEVRDPDGKEIIAWALSAGADAIFEQAGDVCEVFERALMKTKTGPGCEKMPRTTDAFVLTTIADVANAESDLSTSWSKLGTMVARDDAPLDPSDPHESFAHAALDRFISEVLVERAQDLATKAAKARQDALEAQHLEHLREERLGRGVP